MKGTLYDLKGSKKGTIDMPAVFDTRVRADLVQKYFEASKLAHLYASHYKAGKKHSASGIISHKRHDWKAHYGRGISRVPRKVMWRRGVNFYWIGAEISSARGGRRAHPPKGIGTERKINKKEVKLAMNAAFAATANKDHVVSRYATLDTIGIDMPLVIQSPPEGMKTKEFMALFKTMFGDVFRLVLQHKSVRAGKGKSRGRKYKQNAGLLLVTGKEEKISLQGVTVKSVGDVAMSDLYPLGRLTVYTEKAIAELGREKR